MTNSAARSETAAFRANAAAIARPTAPHRIRGHAMTGWFYARYRRLEPSESEDEAGQSRETARSGPKRRAPTMAWAGDVLFADVGREVQTALRVEDLLSFRGVCKAARSSYAFGPSADAATVFWSSLDCCDISKTAARLGQPQFLASARLVTNCWPERCSFYLARHGKISLLRFAKAQTIPIFDGAFLCAGAAASGNFAALRWARLNGAPWDESTTAALAKRGALSELKWARSNGCAWSADVAIDAMDANHRAVVKWALENGCPSCPEIFVTSAENGDVEAIGWLLRLGCVFDGRVAAAAARGGSVQTLHWLLSTGCPWDTRVLSEGTIQNHDEVVRYALSRGCPSDAGAVRGCVLNGNVALLTACLDSGLPWSAAAIALAERIGSAACLQCAALLKARDWDRDAEAFGWVVE